MKPNWRTIGGIGAVAALVAACAAGVIASPATAGNTSLRKGTLHRVFPAGTTAPAANDANELHVTIKEWDVPTKGAHPHDPAVGMDGALWFTEQMQNKIGLIR